MTKNVTHCLLFATCPTLGSAQLIAYTLVEQQLVAGVSLLPDLRSIYRWQGVIKDHTEIGLMMRTRVEHFTKIQEIFTTLHPYQVPELILLPIEQGAENYLAWIDASCPL